VQKRLHQIDLLINCLCTFCYNYVADAYKESTDDQHSFVTKPLRDVKLLIDVVMYDYT